MTAMFTLFLNGRVDVMINCDVIMSLSNISYAIRPRDVDSFVRFTLISIQINLMPQLWLQPPARYSDSDSIQMSWTLQPREREIKSTEVMWCNSDR